VAGRAERLPLREGVVAWAWVSTVVHHLDDLDAAAAELGRVLRPGGVVLVRQAVVGRMEHITLYERFFPAAGARLAGAQFAAGLAALDRAMEAETVPAPVVDRLDLLVLRR